MKRLPYLSIAIISAAALAYEILLMRLFGIIQWHHFAYMIISLALLGYGASGTFLSLAKNFLLKNPGYAYLVNLLFFALSSILSFWAAQQTTFDPLELLWDYRQLFALLWLYLLLAIPFFFVANAIGLMLMQGGSNIGKLYGANLLGSGLGSLGILLLLSLFFPESILLLITLFSLFGAMVAVWETGIRIDAKVTSLFLLVLVTTLYFGRDFSLRMNPYKDLSQTLKIGGTKVIAERSSALERLTVVQSSEIPFRYVPGLSMAWGSEPPEQLAIFTDGDGMSMITRFQSDFKGLGYLAYQTSSLAYHLHQISSPLIVGAGGGSDVLQALYHQAKQIDAIEIDPQMVGLVADQFADFSGHLYSRDNVTIYTAEARSFIDAYSKKYDLIQMALVESFGASSAGLYALSENYLYTTEAFSHYIDHLGPGGYLSITRWLKLPPRDMLKLFATAVEALESKGIKEPEKQIVMIRGLQTGTLLIKNGIFGPKEIEALKHFAQSRFFDIVYYDGMPITEANRYNRLDKPFFYTGVQEILKNREAFYDRYKFAIRPASDDKPYFNHFFKWKTLSELFSLRGTGGLNLLEWGYLILIATLLQAIVASILLIILPLLFRKRRQGRGSKVSRAKVLLYFFSLGFAFLFLEIYFIQRSILFLTQPLSSVAVVLSSFLIFAGAGSALSAKLAQSRGYHTVTGYAVLSIVVLALLYIWMLDGLFGLLMNESEWFKSLVVIVLIAPVAFAMGMPFPMGLTALAGKDKGMIPWAWAVNGCASVISAVAATLLSIHFGFLSVMLSAIFFYLTALLFFPA